jgi:O-antigen/teichoic acid export membrane protein
VKLQFKIDREYVSSSFKYTAGSFLANLFQNIPGLLLPIIILAILGERSAALFFVGLTIGNVLQDVPFTLTTALFVEGSLGGNLRKNAIKAFLASYALLIPAFLVFYFLGGYLLALYGGPYADALGVLRLLAFASFFITIYYIFSSIQKVKMGMASLVKFNVVLAATIIVASCLLLKPLGIEGAGLAVVGTYFLMDLVVLAKARKEGWI